jgi:diguanylate cyclase (GGDEF)-like protein
MLANLSIRKLNKGWAYLTVSLFCILFFIVVKTLPSVLQPSQVIVPEISYLATKTNQYDIDSVRQVPESKWQTSQNKRLSLGLSDNTFWLAFALARPEITQPQLLHIDNPLLDSLSVWIVDQNKILNEHHVGDILPFKQRILSDKSFLFAVPNTDKPLTIYIRIRSTGSLHLPIKIWQNNDYLKFNSRNNLILGLFLGLMLAMGLSYFFLFVTSKRLTFLIYSGYVSCLGLTLATLSGLGYQYLWPDFPWLQQHALGIFGCLSLCLAMIFCQRLLHVKTYNLRLSRILTLSAYSILFGLVLSLILPLGLFIQTFALVLCVAGVLVLGVAIWLWFKGVSIAILYTFSWAILLITSLMVCLDSLGSIQLGLPSYYLLVLGGTVETSMLALILAINHNQQRQALLTSQTELLEKERQAQSTQKEMLTLQENVTEDLEYKVQERTLELEVALRELSDINRELEQKNTLDALTGIRNRRYFDKKYQAEVRRSRREQTELSIAMIDIDHFKKVNDEYGHLVGDECIKSVATILNKALKRPSDDVCRYGGEEFALILPHTDLNGALALVEQLRVEIQNTTIQAEDVSINITISAGVGSAIAELNQSEDAILALADKQLYLAKNAGRNHVKGRHLDVVQDQE